MKKQEKAIFIQSTLEKLYPNPGIPLDHKDNYTLLIAVLLSAQSTDKGVNKVTPLLFNKADTPEKMIKLSIEEIREIIRPVGLSPFKAKSIWHLSKLLLEKHNGNVPSTMEELEALPGVGHKTASVLLCQAFNKPAFPVDTHIHRCAKRWGLSPGNNVKQTEEDLKKLFKQESWIKLHLQMIYFAREHCPAKGHNEVNCPVCSTINTRKKKLW